MLQQRKPWTLARSEVYFLPPYEGKAAMNESQTFFWCTSLRCEFTVTPPHLPKTQAGALQGTCNIVDIAASDHSEEEVINTLKQTFIKSPGDKPSILFIRGGYIKSKESLPQYPLRSTLQFYLTQEIVSPQNAQPVIWDMYEDQTIDTDLHKPLYVRKTPTSALWVNPLSLSEPATDFDVTLGFFATVQESLATLHQRSRVMENPWDMDGITELNGNVTFLIPVDAESYPTVTLEQVTAPQISFEDQTALSRFSADVTIYQQSGILTSNEAFGRKTARGGGVM